MLSVDEIAELLTKTERNNCTNTLALGHLLYEKYLPEKAEICLNPGTAPKNRQMFPRKSSGR